MKHASALSSDSFSLASVDHLSSRLLLLWTKLDNRLLSANPTRIEDKRPQTQADHLPQRIEQAKKDGCGGESGSIESKQATGSSVSRLVEKSQRGQAIT